MRTYIESATKERFATRFLVLENNLPTDEYVVVMKLIKNDMAFLVHRYRLALNTGYEDLGTVRMGEEKFLEEFKPHCSYKKTSLNRISDVLENTPRIQEQPKSITLGRTKNDDAKEKARSRLKI